MNKVDIEVNVRGGGINTQAEASRLAVAKVLVEFLKTTKLKEMSLVMLKNGPADIVLTTTKEHVDILKDNGITKHIEVVPEGIDPDIYNTFCSEKHIDTKKFTFITVGKNEKRKCSNEIVEAFMEVADGKSQGR